MHKAAFGQPCFFGENMMEKETDLTDETDFWS
jgi:hypothetical protein